MRIERKKEREIVPSYSLTGDLLSYLRCGLQYRYHQGSALPPSRPVQLWTGEFIHGVMEAEFQQFKDGALSFPCPCNPTPFGMSPDPTRLAYDIGVVGERVEAGLRAEGKSPRSRTARERAYERADEAVNLLGPHLFPLIASAEEKVIGTRRMPPVTGGGTTISRASLYELHGVIDVVTNVELSAAISGNPVKNLVQEKYPALTGKFEVLVDYKAARRPSLSESYWEQGEWQLQTYAWLRSRQPGALPVVAGILFYIHELMLSKDDISKLQRDTRSGNTDVVPLRGSQDWHQLMSYRPGDPPPRFSNEFRIRRAIRVVKLDDQSLIRGTTAFDNCVLDIEQHIAKESQVGKILSTWPVTGDEPTCASCDFRYFCPSPAGRRNQVGYSPEPPDTP